MNPTTTFVMFRSWYCPDSWPTITTTFVMFRSGYCPGSWPTIQRRLSTCRKENALEQIQRPKMINVLTNCPVLCTLCTVQWNCTIHLANWLVVYGVRHALHKFIVRKCRVLTRPRNLKLYRKYFFSGSLIFLFLCAYLEKLKATFLLVKKL